MDCLQVELTGSLLPEMEAGFTVHEHLSVQVVHTPTML
jgi:hypothetical protein